MELKKPDGTKLTEGGQKGTLKNIASFELLLSSCGVKKQLQKHYRQIASNSEVL